jgi:hypothetical protein
VLWVLGRAVTQHLGLGGVLTVRVPKKEVPPHEQMGDQVPIDWKEL